jgi:hypothetical protein
MGSIHAAYIDTRIQKMLRKDKFKNDDCGISGSDEWIVHWVSSNICTNYVQRVFTPTYMKKHPCGCGAPSKERCHGIGEERPELLRRALYRLRGKNRSSVLIRDLVVAFFEEHKTTQFTFKCKVCHAKEPKTKHK